MISVGCGVHVRWRVVRGRPLCGFVSVLLQDGDGEKVERGERAPDSWHHISWIAIVHAETYHSSAHPGGISAIVLPKEPALSSSTRCLNLVYEIVSITLFRNCLALRDCENVGGCVRQRALWRAEAQGRREAPEGQVSVDRGPLPRPHDFQASVSLTHSCLCCSACMRAT